MNELTLGAVMLVGFLAVGAWFVTGPITAAAIAATAAAAGVMFGYMWGIGIGRHESADNGGKRR